MSQSFEAVAMSDGNYQVTVKVDRNDDLIDLTSYLDADADDVADTTSVRVQLTISEAQAVIMALVQAIAAASKNT